MARDPRKAQKAKERRNKKAKEKHKAAARAKSVSPLAVFDKLDGSVVTRCAVNTVMEEQGITNLYVCREFPSGAAVVVVFLIDVFCLGVKDVLFERTNAGGAVEMYRTVAESGPLRGITPAEAKKLCLGAVAFAAKYGLPPYPDYAQAVKVFDGIDESACDTEFTFGKDGKPYYVVGPHDGPAKQRRIIDTLEWTAGRGGYHFVLPVVGPPGGEFGDGDEFDDDEDELPEGGGWSLPPRKW